jgi:hypothetical protein
VSTVLKTINLVLAFAVELAMIVAFATWALSLQFGVLAGWTLAVALVAGSALLWGIWAAPRSERRLGPLPLLVFKLVLFGLAVAALLAARQMACGMIFGAFAALHLALAWHVQQV